MFTLSLLQIGYVKKIEGCKISVHTPLLFVPLYPLAKHGFIDFCFLFSIISTLISIKHVLVHSI